MSTQKHCNDATDSTKVQALFSTAVRNVTGNSLPRILDKILLFILLGYCTRTCAIA